MRFSTEPNGSIRVKGINRMNIPGGFDTVILADGKPIAKRFFFQASNPKECANCKKEELVNLDFSIPMNKISGKTLDVEIHVLDTVEGLGSNFPLDAAGDPSVNVRVLLEDR